MAPPGLLLSEDDGTLIEAVKTAGKPSLFGRNIAAFMIELTPEGATLFEQALQGKGGVVQVVYDLYFWAKLPELYARAWFEAEKFYSYEQTIDIDWSMYGDDEYVDKITEEFEDHETMGIELRFDAVLPDPEADRKLKERIRANMEQALQDAVLRKMIPDIDDDPDRCPRACPRTSSTSRREFETTKVATFETEYRENTAIEWNIAPQGTLPNITNLIDAEGNPSSGRTTPPSSTSTIRSSSSSTSRSASTPTSRRCRSTRSRSSSSTTTATSTSSPSTPSPTPDKVETFSTFIAERQARLHVLLPGQLRRFEPDLQLRRR